ncbi:leucyl/phenylalanyl-tRNA--protein transferase [Thioclava sp. SK-1]|uniref:leucyl/phenylalanyl-tRNA--protein transferase n=1 Tax=Thioclava sp. SK-1 TaxID=1889770 RepID=UPI0008243A52|nr:leucyl/phenylalanyl-tRNA--protein transferase [Thioclava sp. SK-1]OCX64593.1 leucyl/phenylalanyl-tRNA--protein transferase [Thioclava sp. SK-1]
MTDRLTAQALLTGYARGIFPMAESRDDDTLYWFEPKLRGIIPLNGFRLSRSLAKELRKARYQIRVNTDFRATVEGCAARDETWINDALFALYDDLHAADHAHSLEVWNGAKLVGGVFGVTLGGAFFGESMFSRVPNASKIALAYAVDRLRQNGFKLFDTQYLTSHLASLGGIEISRKDYQIRLSQALHTHASFTKRIEDDPQSVLQRMTQTS